MPVRSFYIGTPAIRRVLWSVLISSSVLVRRVVEARRVYQQQGNAPTRRPSSRAGQSMHTTALPPTTADASVRRARNGRARRRRFFGLGFNRKSSEPASPAGICKRRTLRARMDEKEADKDEEAIEPRGCLLRRLCCCR